MNETKIWIDPADVAEVLFGVHALASGMVDEVYNHTTEGVMTADERFTAEQNARTFVYDYYGMTSGAFRLIAGAMSIITNALADGDLDIEVGKEPINEQSA